MKKKFETFEEEMFSNQARIDKLKEKLGHKDKDLIEII